MDGTGDNGTERKLPKPYNINVDRTEGNGIKRDSLNREYGAMHIFYTTASGARKTIPCTARGKALDGARHIFEDGVSYAGPLYGTFETTETPEGSVQKFAMINALPCPSRRAA